MRRVRRLAIVLIALGVVTGAIYMTGAFSVLTATRNADVRVTGDASGYLGLRPAPGPNGVYAQQKPNGELSIVLGKVGTGSSATGKGLNLDAVTTIKNIFTITNQGSQPIGLWLTDGSDAVTFKVDGRSIEGRGQAITIEPGTTKSVGLVIDTRQVSKGEDLLGSVTFHGSASVAGTDLPAQSRSGTDSEPVPVAETGNTPVPSTPATSGNAQGDGTDTRQQQNTQQASDEDNGGIWNTVTDVGSGVLNTVTDVGSGIWNTVSDVGSDIWNGISDIANAAGDIVGGLGGVIISSGIMIGGAVAMSDGPSLALDAVGVVIVVGAVAVGLLVAGGMYLHDQVTTSGEKEVDQAEKENGEEVTNPEQADQTKQKHEEEGESDSRRKPKPPRLRPPKPDLVPDGGKDDHHAGYDALQKQDVPDDTIEEWADEGYDLQQMSEALKTYEKSGETLHSTRHEAKGELGEIIAKSEVMSDYPRSEGYKYVNGVKLNKGAEGEIDWVVVDKSTGDVVATYQVKTHPHKADDAREQATNVKEEFKDGNVNQIDEAPNSLTVTDFTDNLNEIERYTIGPKNGHGYNETMDLTRTELEALLDAIRKGNL